MYMYKFVLSLEPKITYFLMVSLLRRKIAYVMLTSIPWEYVMHAHINFMGMFKFVGGW